MSDEKNYVLTLEVRIKSEANMSELRDFLTAKLRDAKQNGKIEYAIWGVQELPQQPLAITEKI